MKLVHILLLALAVMQVFAACGVPPKAAEQETVPTSLHTESPETTEEAKPTEETERNDTEEMIYQELPERQDQEFVAVKEYIPEIIVELKYAQEDNFTGKVIYSFRDTYLRYGTVKKLAAVCEELADQGLYIKIWDGFRPVSAQFKLWEVFPDSNYVANPNKGFSPHSRGNTVDITLVDADGRELEMPSAFDDFSALADRDYSDCSEVAANNARLLEQVMQKHGFTGYFMEWWHFVDSVRYEVEHCFDPSLISNWYAHCEEFISLRTEPDVSAEVITKIPVKGEFLLLGFQGEFAYVEYQGLRGFVLPAYIRPVVY